MKLTDEQRAMVEANMGLVGWAVSRWGRHLPTTGRGYTQDDAYQDATFGLMRAVVGFDPDKGFRFATYASAWLQQSIVRGQGTFEGLSHRRIEAGTDTPEDHRKVVSLDSPGTGDTDEGATGEIERLAAEGDMAEAAIHGLEVRDLWIETLARRNEVCRDTIDRILWDVMFDVSDDRPRHAKLAACAERVGRSHELMRRRWHRICQRLTEPADGTPTSSLDRPARMG